MQFLYRFGNLFGWLTVIFFGATILNYVIKFINKNWGKKLPASSFLKSILSFLMKVFVKNHKIWGFLAFFALMLHFILQFLRFGLSFTGILAAVLLFLQVFLGMYAVTAKKPRKGAWFIFHRLLAVVLIFGVVFHVLLPFGARSRGSFKPSNTAKVTNTTATTDTSAKTSTSASSGTTASTATADTSSGKVFSLSDLKKYNGKNGQPAYVAYNGVVYDVSNVPQWKNGNHHGETAGTDITNDMSSSPHGDSVLSNVPVVGTLK